VLEAGGRIVQTAEIEKDGLSEVKIDDKRRMKRQMRMRKNN